MSEYTSYGVVHVEDLKLVCSELSKDGVTGVLLADPKHPLYDAEQVMEKWGSLPFEAKWLVLMTTDDVRNRYKFLPLSVSITIDENPDRWELRLDNNGETRRCLFSDGTWGDVYASNETTVLPEQDNAAVVSADDLAFMETIFRIERTKFSDYLKMGPGNALNFLSAVGLPSIEMLCDWQFYYPDEGLNRCMLWQEYDKIVSAYHASTETDPLDLYYELKV